MFTFSRFVQTILPKGRILLANQMTNFPSIQGGELVSFSVLLETKSFTADKIRLSTAFSSCQFCQ